MQKQENQEQSLEKLIKLAQPTFWGYLGCKMESMDENGVVISLDAKQHHLNLMKIVHGGVLSSLMDNAMGLAVMMLRPGEPTVTSNLNIHFLAPAKEGRLIVKGEVLHQTRRSLTTQARIETSGGELIALGTGLFRIL
ncbi:PaaI family thioesterase [Paenibacillus sediminis]|uniref:Uncharacterized protein (TIGR00369 family) n=1 Tax=Paenibacillus sediminis TaxID=664909 RepID=A0ABS4H3F3_9BACL|nr:PaaI family thioesterase [Paenibacillus sediminis]MBP1937055.1 uncharacterized protein (TIGR00369 family) [Paenibacillus sediminis]